MSAIEARIRAFESLKQDQPKTAARKQPIKLYEPENEDQTSASNAPNTSLGERDKDTSDEAHELSVGSLTSDFVKVSPPRAKAPPLPPRKESSNTSSSSPSVPSTPSSEGFVSNGSSAKRSGSVPRSPPTPRPIPQKNKPSTAGSPGRLVSPNAGAFGGPNPNSLTVNNRFSKSHMPTPSASSFHSVSLSDHDHHLVPLESHPPSDHEDRESGLGGSYEAVHISPHGGSVFSLVDRTGSMASSPATSVSNLGLAPPALPPRHNSGSISPSHTNTSLDSSNAAPVPYAVRKVPPPPPGQSRGLLNKGQRPTPLENISPRSSPRTSLVSNASTSFASYNNGNHSSLSRTSTAASSSNVLQSISKRKPPPLPPAARARYDAVFDANMKAQKERRASAKETGKDRPSSMQRRAVGWRGTSVDLTTGSMGGPNIGEEDLKVKGVGEEERLSGKVVRLIWECSKLSKGSLRVIWDECDSHHRGSLDKAEFANGMWRIDNELLSAASLRSDKAGSRRSYGGAPAYNIASQSRW